MNGDKAEFRTRALELLYKEGYSHRETVARIVQELEMNRHHVDAELRSMGRWVHSDEIDLPVDSLIRALAMFRGRIYSLVDAADEADGAAEDERATAMRKEAAEAARGHARLAHHVGHAVTDFETEMLDLADGPEGEADSQ